MSEPLKVIITGATGMVGEGVLLECLANSAVAEVLLVGRKPYPAEHPKLKQLVIADFMNITGIIASQFSGYDACFFCAGISSVGLSEAEYTHITYDLTLHFAETLAPLNPQMTFIYVSGGSTDSTEKGRVMWARVKGRTENALMRLPFHAAYNFRPGFMKATPGQKNVKSYYNLIGWLYPIVRPLAPNLVSTLRDVALAMIHATQHGYPKQILEIKDINELAHT
jgi:uncharacterized protein YbjT (DUF2867 family)